MVRFLKLSLSLSVIFHCAMCVDRQDLASNISNISFIQAMEPNTNFKAAAVLQNSEWRLAKQLYEKYILSNQYYSQETRIPKIIHHIWLGSSLPEQYRRFRETWIKFHPDWECILWTDKEIEAFGLQNKKLYDSVANYGAKSDIARCEILYRMGGLYIDTDFECLRSFDVLHHLLDFYTGIAFDKAATLFNGLIASVPGHPILKRCIESLSSTKPFRENSGTIMQATGPFLLTRSFFNVVPSLNDSPIAAFPTAYFYAWPAAFRNQSNPKQWIRKESFALHHWAVSWSKK